MTTAKPTAEQISELLGVRLDDLPWRTSGSGEGMFQVAIIRDDEATWVLVRVMGGLDVQVYTEHEWRCFVDGVRAGEFDDLV